MLSQVAYGVRNITSTGTIEIVISPPGGTPFGLSVVLDPVFVSPTHLFNFCLPRKCRACAQGLPAWQLHNWLQVVHSAI